MLFQAGPASASVSVSMHFPFRCLLLAGEPTEEKYHSAADQRNTQQGDRMPGQKSTEHQRKPCDDRSCRKCQICFFSHRVPLLSSLARFRSEVLSLIGCLQGIDDRPEKTDRNAANYRAAKHAGRIPRSHSIPEDCNAGKDGKGGQRHEYLFFHAYPFPALPLRFGMIYLTI